MIYGETQWMIARVRLDRFAAIPLNPFCGNYRSASARQLPETRAKAASHGIKVKHSLTCAAVYRHYICALAPGYPASRHVGPSLYGIQASPRNCTREDNAGIPAGSPPRQFWSPRTHVGTRRRTPIPALSSLIESRSSGPAARRQPGGQGTAAQ